MLRHFAFAILISTVAQAARTTGIALSTQTTLVGKPSYLVVTIANPSPITQTVTVDLRSTGNNTLEAGGNTFGITCSTNSRCTTGAISIASQFTKTFRFAQNTSGSTPMDSAYLLTIQANEDRGYITAHARSESYQITNGVESPITDSLLINSGRPF